jgi:hypothetical protein
MCKEMPVISVNRVVDTKNNNQKKWRAEEEERHNGLLTLKIHKHFIALNHSIFLERPEASFNFTTRGEILPPWVQLAPGVNFVP